MKISSLLPILKKMRCLRLLSRLVEKTVMMFRHKLLRMLGGCLALYFLWGGVPAEANSIKIYFYSSESNINNFKSLKLEFDRYLSTHGPYEFQPFSRRDLFEGQLANGERYLVLLSSWHYRNIAGKYQLKPILLGVLHGKTTQKRVLVAKNPANLETARLRIASASSVDHTEEVLRHIFQQESGVQRENILTVPKDIDALMSVGFGISRAALITENSLVRFQNINPTLSQKMQLLAESPEAFLLVVAAPQSFTEGSEAAAQLFQAMAEQSEGKKRIQMLGLESWQLVQASDLVKLEK